MNVREVRHEDVTWLASLGLLGFRPHYQTGNGAIYLEDSLKILQTMPASSVDLVMTSPPFALTRQKEYGNEPIDRYIAWLMPFCDQIFRVLKDDGSFVLDIGGSWEPGAPVRSMYHFEVAVKLARKFKLAQEFYWFNPARLPSPAEWVTVRRVRVKDAVNMVWWFGKTENPKADNRRVLQPYSEAMKSLLQKGYRAKKRPSGHDISTKFAQDNGGAIPPNVFTTAHPTDDLPSNFLPLANTESNSHYLRVCREMGTKPHPARYPENLVRFFLAFLTDPGDLVVDPFGGSNVTGAVCEAMNRRWVAAEINREYVEGSRARFVASAADLGAAPAGPTQPALFDGGAATPKKLRRR
ncbi:MAG: site-specific DNA-methyltransferase [Gemmataceae bacterium]|nr:site-specific DNA-methyltransferase [Gemmataceae bacterium]